MCEEKQVLVFEWGPPVHRVLVQVPLDNGTDDATFHKLFKPIMDKVVQVFQPGAIVLQCGAPPPVFRSNLRVRFTGCSSPS